MADQDETTTMRRSGAACVFGKTDSRAAQQGRIDLPLRIYTLKAAFEVMPLRHRTAMLQLALEGTGMSAEETCAVMLREHVEHFLTSIGGYSSGEYAELKARVYEVRDELMDEDADDLHKYASPSPHPHVTDALACAIILDFVRTEDPTYHIWKDGSRWAPGREGK